MGYFIAKNSFVAEVTFKTITISSLRPYFLLDVILFGYGYDDISIRMLKICDLAIVKPLAILFKTCISQGIFPDNWQKSNTCPIHKKDDKKKIVNKYRPVSLLQIYGKIFE